MNLLPGSLIILPLYIAAVPGALPSTIKIADWVVRSSVQTCIPPQCPSSSLTNVFLQEKSKKALIEAKATGASNFMNHVKGLVESTPETNDYDHVLTPDIRNKITSLSSKVRRLIDALKLILFLFGSSPQLTLNFATLICFLV